VGSEGCPHGVVTPSAHPSILESDWLICSSSSSGSSSSSSSSIHQVYLKHVV